MTKLTMSISTMEELLISNIREIDDMDTFCRFAECILGLYDNDVRYDPELEAISIETDLSLEEMCITKDEIKRFGIIQLPDKDRIDQ